MTTPASAPASKGFAIPPRMHVIVLFMIQFITLISVFGGVVPTLHQQGYSTPLLVVGSLVFVVAFHFIVGLLGKLVPVRCRQCGAQSRFQGYGWWPFIYRYLCAQCGAGLRIEVGRR